MKSLIVILLISSVSVGCSSGTAAPSAEGAGPPAEANVLVIGADSPTLGQIKRDVVGVADVPTDEMTAPGRIEANPNRISKVALPVTGRITAVLVKVGDAVAKSQPLLRVQSPDADAAMSTARSAEASVTQAQAALAKAQADFDRSSDLFEHDAVAKKDVLAAQSALTQATAAVEQAQASREQAQRRLVGLGLTPGDPGQEVVVRAPLAGKILDLSIVPGEFRNDTSVSVMTIADLRTVWVTSQVPESYIRFVHLGQRVEISLVAYPGETLEGRVSRLADTVDPQTRTVKVQAEMDNPAGRFRPEMYGSIHHIESTTKAMVIPSGAIVHEGERTLVFVERAPGRFEEREVVLGKRVGDLVRVSDGLKAGDSIVVDGAMLLSSLMKRS